MSGYFTIPRVDKDLFGDDDEQPESRRGAWHWLFDNAAWKDIQRQVRNAKIMLRRGELCCSIRFLAKIWRWSLARVRHFLDLLAQRGLLTIRVDPSARVTVITLTRYWESLNNTPKPKQAAAEMGSRESPSTQRRIQERKEDLEKEKGSDGRCAPSDADREHVATAVARTTDALAGRRVFDPVAHDHGRRRNKWELWLAGAQNDGGLLRFVSETIPAGDALWAAHAAIQAARDAGSREALALINPAVLREIDRLDRVYRMHLHRKRDAARGTLIRRPAATLLAH